MEVGYALTTMLSGSFKQKEALVYRGKGLSGKGENRLLLIVTSKGIKTPESTT